MPERPDHDQARLAVLLHAALDAERDEAGDLTPAALARLKALAKRLAEPLTEAERKDKLGRRMCFDDASGKRTKCAPLAKKPAAKKTPAAKEPAPKKKPAPKKPAVKKPPTKKPVEKPAEKKAGAGRKKEPAGKEPAAARPAARVLAQRDPAEVRRAAATTAPLAGEDARAVADYVSADSSGYKKVNAALRGQGGTAEDRRKGERINAAVRRAKPLPQPVSAYRGVEATSPEAAAYIESLLAAEPGAEIEQSGLMSTSLDPLVALQFAKVGKKKILVRVSARQGLAVDAALPGQTENEAEFLMAHGSRFRVVGQEEVEYDKGGGRTEKVRTVHLEQIT